MDYKIKLFLAIKDAESYVESIPMNEVKQLVVLDRLRRLKKRGLAGKTDYLEEDLKIKSREIRALKGILFVKKIKDILGCLKCQETHHSCLEFHHVEPDEKLFSVSQSPSMSLNLDDIKREIMKCILICANCHKKEHYLDICAS